MGSFLLSLFYLPIVLLFSAVDGAERFFQNGNALLEWFLSSSVLILAVLLLRFLLKGRVSYRVRYALWLVVLVRVLLPIQFALPLPASAAQLTPEAPESWKEATVPVYPSYGKVENAPAYYQDLEPGTIYPSAGSVGYVERAEDGETMIYYWDLYSPIEVFLRLWWAGSLVTGGVLLVSNLHFSRRVKRSRALLPEISAPIPVYEADGLPSPCLFGLFRPAVYLTPATAAEGEKREHALAHELTHYRHRDHIWAFARCLCLVLHWFDPLVWVAAVLSRRDCELACDEGAVARLGESERIPYGRTLVDMVAQGGRGGLLSCSTTMTVGAKPLRQRVEALVKRPRTRITALLLAAVLLTAAALFTFAADEPTQKELGLSTPEEGYARLLDLLENDLPFSYHESLFSDGPEYDAVTSPNIVPNTKSTARNHIRPLDRPMENLAFSAVQTQAHHLWLYSGEEPYLEQTSFCLLPVEDEWYVCLRESDRNENDTLIPVAKTDAGVVNVLKNAASLQLQVNAAYWTDPAKGFEQFAESLSNTVQIQTFVANGQTQTAYQPGEEFTAHALGLLARAEPLSAPTENFGAAENELALHLYDELGVSSSAGWNCRDYYLHPAQNGYYLCLRHDWDVDTPVAFLPGDTATRLLALAYSGHIALEEYDRFQQAVESVTDIKFCGNPLSSTRPVTHIPPGEDLENAKRMLLEYSQPLTYGADATRAGVPLHAFVLLGFDSSGEYQYNISPNAEGEYTIFRTEDGRDVPVAQFDKSAVSGLGLLAE